MSRSTSPIVPPKGSQMPPLTPACCRVKIGRTGSAVGSRLVACRPGAHLAELGNFGSTSPTQPTNLGSEFPIFPARHLRKDSQPRRDLRKMSPTSSVALPTAASKCHGRALTAKTGVRVPRERHKINSLAIKVPECPVGVPFGSKARNFFVPLRCSILVLASARSLRCHCRKIPLRARAARIVEGSFAA
jgi:hypothetical protein